MIRSLLSALLALSSVAAAAQTGPQADQPGTTERAPEERWVRSDTQVASRIARTAFPTVAGPISLAGTREYSHPGEGIDDSLSYRSADGAVIGTVYVYQPGLAHAGLSAYTTDAGIRATSTTPVRAGNPRLVAAGGVANAAIRIDYQNYRGMDSAAAFIKAGRWIIKLRVSAPEGRRAEVDAAMAALLAGIQFGSANPAREAAPLNVSTCPSGAGAQGARLLPDPTDQELAALALLGTFDGGGVEATDEGGRTIYLPSRVPGELCLSTTLEIGANRVPILRSGQGDPAGVDGRTRLLALISDSGTLIELVHAPNLNRYVMLYHQIGSTALLGSYDGVPSDAQIREMIAGPQSDATRVRAQIRLRPDRGPEIDLAPGSRPPPTTQQTPTT